MFTEQRPDNKIDKITKGNILEYYQVPENELASLYKTLQMQAESLGFRVVLADLSQLRQVNDPKAIEAKHDTCQSDGLTVYLHNNLDKVGGQVSRVYDLMHVGLGHGTQWAAGPDSGLKFSGDPSWAIATKAYVGASEQDLETVYDYELEAGRLGLMYMRKALQSSPELQQSGVLQMYSDYVRRDLQYIMDYYRTGKVMDFFENFQTHQPLLEEIGIPSNLEPKARENQAIPLIRLS